MAEKIQDFFVTKLIDDFLKKNILFFFQVINNLQSNHALVILVADNLTAYVDSMRHNPAKVLAGDPVDLYPDGRYNHILQVCVYIWRLSTAKRGFPV